MLNHSRHFSAFLIYSLVLIISLSACGGGGGGSTDNSGPAAGAASVQQYALAAEASSAVILYAGFPGYGLWKHDGSTWSKLTPDLPEGMAASGTMLYGDFGALGLWIYNGSSWLQLTPDNPENICASESALYGDFGARGLWKHNGINWLQLTADNPQTIAVSGSTFYGGFGSLGLWKHDGTSWSWLTSDNPQNIAASGSTLYGDFGALGLWKYNGTYWSQLTPDNPENIAASGSNLYGDFGALGLWKYNGTSWSQLTTDNPENIAASGTTLYGDFGTLGVWKHDGTNWSLLTTDNPTVLAIGGSIDFQEISAMLSQYMATLNKGSLTFQDLDPFFATNYGIDNGLDRTSSIVYELENAPSGVPGKTITGVVSLFLEAINTGDYRVTGLATFADGSMGWREGGYIVTKENNTWKFKGNGYLSHIDIQSRNMQWVYSDHTIQECGLLIRIRDLGNNNLQTATVTGPGLGSGISLTKDPYQPENMNIDAQYRQPLPDYWNYWLYVMSDLTVDSMPDNAEYIVNIFNIRSVFIETRTIKVPKRPLKRTEITSAHYPSSTMTSHKISDYLGKTLNIVYSKPTAYSPTWMDMTINFLDNTGNYLGKDVQLLLNQTSTSVTISNPAWSPTTGSFQLAAQDQLQRGFKTVWELAP